MSFLDVCRLGNRIAGHRQSHRMIALICIQSRQGNRHTDTRDSSAAASSKSTCHVMLTATTNFISVTANCGMSGSKHGWVGFSHTAADSECGFLLSHVTQVRWFLTGDTNLCTATFSQFWSESLISDTKCPPETFNPNVTLIWLFEIFTAAQNKPVLFLHLRKTDVVSFVVITTFNLRSVTLQSHDGDGCCGSQLSLSHTVMSWATSRADAHSGCDTSLLVRYSILVYILLWCTYVIICVTLSISGLTDRAVFSSNCHHGINLGCCCKLKCGKWSQETVKCWSIN